jgi:hypothetical protein
MYLTDTKLMMLFFCCCIIQGWESAAPIDPRGWSPGYSAPAGLIYAGCLQEGWAPVGEQDSQGALLQKLESIIL